MDYLKYIYTPYSVFLKLLGFERSANALIRRLDVTIDQCRNILDIGCGTGVVGLTLMQRFPHSSLLATDNDSRFFPVVREHARQSGVPAHRVTTAFLDVSSPSQVTLADGSTRTLQEQEFDIVSASGVIGYARDQEASIRALLKMIRPGGYFIDVELSDGLIGTTTGLIFRYPLMRRTRLRQIIESEGFTVQRVRIPMSCFPSSVTRMCVVACRNGEKR